MTLQRDAAVRGRRKDDAPALRIGEHVCSGCTIRKLAFDCTCNGVAKPGAFAIGSLGPDGEPFDDVVHEGQTRA